MPLGSVLLSASLIWNGPLRRGLEGKRWWEGSKGSLGGILMSHLGPSLSHLYQCEGCRAPEQVGKPLTLKTPALSQGLWPAVSWKPSLPCLWTKSHWTYTFTLLHVMCVKSHEPKAVECLHAQRNIYIYIIIFSTEHFSASCRLQSADMCWTLERKIRMISRPRRFSQALCACVCFKNRKR